MSTKTKISPADFSRLVKQANLVLSDQEKTTIHNQLDEALDSVKVMSQLDTKDVPSTTSASGLTNVLREDVVKPSFTQDQALQNAKHTHQGYFMVPAIFEAQDN